MFLSLQIISLVSNCSHAIYLYRQICYQRILWHFVLLYNYFVQIPSHDCPIREEEEEEEEILFC